MEWFHDFVLQQEKKPAPKKEAEEEEEEEEFKEKPSKDPFAHLPKGTFVMDEWKRTYSNEDTDKVAIPYFWKNFDKENYSIWYGEYLYPKELGKIFMSCNLVGGMFQRLDKMRKHAFGSVCIFGEDDNNTISGVWVWRGQDLAFGVSPVDPLVPRFAPQRILTRGSSLQLSPDLSVDSESYSWKKLDPDNEEHKKMVNEYLLWEGDFGGKKFNQGKVFK